MVLKIVGSAVTAFLPTKYWPYIILSIIAAIIIRTVAQGRQTNRQRILHARVILVTGGFTPMGLTLIQDLAQRGAHIIALSPHPIDSPKVDVLITLLRSTTNNEHIFAEQCDLTSPTSIRSFCTRFLIGQDQRLDALVFAHEYQHIGSLLSPERQAEAAAREVGSLGTFLMVTLLLPALLVAPVERDIRILNVINPFYAAATRDFSFKTPLSSAPNAPPPRQKSLILLEGTRALRAAIFIRHLQRVLDALPSAAQIPPTSEKSSSVPVVSPNVQKSNIVAVSVSPGIGRSDTIAPMLGAENETGTRRSIFGVALYIILQPLLRLLTKSPTSTIQSVLHALFLPTPFKVLSASKSAPGKDDDLLPEEVLKPGALYSECAVVRLKVPRPLVDEADEMAGSSDRGEGKTREGMVIPEDDELGGEIAGRLVWEELEVALQAWEKANPPEVKNKEKVDGGSGVGAGGDSST